MSFNYLQKIKWVEIINKRTELSKKELQQITDLAQAANLFSLMITLLIFIERYNPVFFICTKLR
jgi:hypothetical protein